MKKTVLVIAIVCVLLSLLAAAGCRAVERVPGVSAVQSIMPTLPGVSPSPAYTQTTAGPLGTLGGGNTAGTTVAP